MSEERTCDYCGRVIEPDETYRNLAEEGGGYVCYNTDCILHLIYSTL